AAIASLRASFINEPSTTDTHPLSLHDALPILGGDVHFTTDQRFDAASHRLSVKLHRPMKDAVIRQGDRPHAQLFRLLYQPGRRRSEEHTSELQSRENLVCRLLLEKKKYHRTW